MSLKSSGTASEPPTAAEEVRLVRSARAGDSAAFEELYRRTNGRIYAVCLRMTGNVSQAEDCVQEAFVRAWRKLDTFKGESAFGTWMHRIAVNEVLARQRKERRRGTHLQLVGEDAAPAIPDPTARQPDLGIDLERAIQTLPPGARNVFVLHCVNGHSHQETADQLGIAVGTCKAQLHRARKLLVERLGL